jgi:hypothetical protein
MQEFVTHDYTTVFAVKSYRNEVLKQRGLCSNNDIKILLVRAFYANISAQFARISRNEALHCRFLHRTLNIKT